MAFNNRNNLSNESAPWGREVEQKIESNAYDLNQLRLLTENNNKATNGTLGVLSGQQATLLSQQTTLANQQQVLESTQTTLATQQTTLLSQQTQLAEQQQITSALTSAWSVASYAANFTNVTVAGSFGYQTVTLGTFLVSSPPGDFLTRFCSLSVNASATITNYAGNFNQDIKLDLYLTVQGFGNVEASVTNVARFGSDNSPSTGNTYSTQGVYGFDRKRTQMLSGYSPLNLLVLRAQVLRPMTGGTFRISGGYEIVVETSPQSAVETITPV